MSFLWLCLCILLSMLQLRRKTTRLLRLITDKNEQKDFCAISVRYLKMIEIMLKKKKNQNKMKGTQGSILYKIRVETIGSYLQFKNAITYSYHCTCSSAPSNFHISCQIFSLFYSKLNIQRYQYVELLIT